MFVMISPLQAHLNETLTSLKFATKVSSKPLPAKELARFGADDWQVHNTHIGTAKRQTKAKD
jgi:kinesin family member C1